MEILLILGSGRDIYREYIFHSIAQHYTLVLLQEEDLTWQKPYVLNAMLIPSMNDQNSVINAARSLSAKYKIAGIFTYIETYVELAAVVANVLNLPYNSIDSMHCCRDKRAMRKAWEQAHVPSACSYLVTSVNQAKEIASKIGYPLVLKPRAMAASIGVIQVNVASELDRAYCIAYEASHPTFQGNAGKGILLEEFLPGPEMSIESAIIDGEVHIVALTRKQIGFFPYFEEIGHGISPNEMMEEKHLIGEIVLQAHRALGITMGITHAELRFTPQGPKMIELGARLGGDLIPYLVQLATGIDLALAGAAIAANCRPHLDPTHSSAAAIRFLYPPMRDVKILDIQIDPLTATFPWLDQITWRIKPGDHLSMPSYNLTPRLGFSIVMGNTLKECDERLTSVAEMTHIELD